MIGRQLVADQAFAGRASGLLCGAGKALLAKNRRRFLEVSVCFLERGLAVQHARARLVAELLHVGCADRRHWCDQEKEKEESGVSTAEGSSLKKTFDPLLALRGSRGSFARAAGRPVLPPGGVIAGGIVGPLAHRFDVG